MSDNLSSIEHDIEETRLRLAATIDQLVYRANPKTIARRELDAVKGFFVDPDGEPRTENILKLVGGAAAVIGFFALARKLSR